MSKVGKNCLVITQVKFLFCQKQTQFPKRKCGRYAYQRDQKDKKNAKRPPVAFVGDQLKFKIVFCSKLAALHATEVN